MNGRNNYKACIISRIIVCCLILLVIISVSKSAMAGSDTCILSFYSGSVDILDESSKKMPLNINMVLKKEYTVVTGKDGKVEITLTGDRDVIIGEEKKVKLSDINSSEWGKKTPDYIVDKLKRLIIKSHLYSETATAVAGTRGSKENGKNEVEWLEDDSMLYSAAMKKYYDEKYEDAEEYFKKLISNHPQSVYIKDAENYLDNCLIEMNKLTEVEAKLRSRIINKEEEIGNYQLKLGLLLYEKGKYSEARGLLKSFLDSNKNINYRADIEQLIKDIK